MARPLRLGFPGALFHAYARGDNRKKVFADDADRKAFRSSLFRTAGRLRWRIWSYCVMPNHYHLLVETPEANLSRGMRDLNGLYSQGFNRRHGRVGHVFQGRFKATLVDRDSYLLQVIRYIVNNPVRAGLCRHPGEWVWSSHRDVMGWHERTDPSIQTPSILSLFATDLDLARRRYARFVLEGLDSANPLIAARHQVFLGDEDFVRRSTQGLARPSEEVPRVQRAWTPLQEFQNRHSSRNEAIAAAYREGTHSVASIARHFGLHPSTVSRIGRQDRLPQSGRISRRQMIERGVTAGSLIKT